MHKEIEKAIRRNRVILDASGINPNHKNKQFNEALTCGISSLKKLRSTEIERRIKILEDLSEIDDLVVIAETHTEMNTFLRFLRAKIRDIPKNKRRINCRKRLNKEQVLIQNLNMYKESLSRFLRAYNDPRINCTEEQEDKIL
jgi:hypothetical protein